MMNNERNVREYVKTLADLGYDLEVSVEGLLGVVKNHGEIIFTTAGMTSIGVVEAFLGGVMYSELRRIKADLKKINEK